MSAAETESVVLSEAAVSQIGRKRLKHYGRATHDAGTVFHGCWNPEGLVEGESWGLQTPGPAKIHARCCPRQGNGFLWLTLIICSIFL